MYGGIVESGLGLTQNIVGQMTNDSDYAKKGTMHLVSGAVKAFTANRVKNLANKKIAQNEAKQLLNNENSSSQVSAHKAENKVSFESKQNKEFNEWLNKGDKNSSVYHGIKNDNRVYTGITKQPLKVRLMQHNYAGKGFSDLELQFSNLTRNQARPIEQYLIENVPSVMNQISSISRTNKFYEASQIWAETFVRK